MRAGCCTCPRTAVRTNGSRLTILNASPHSRTHSTNSLSDFVAVQMMDEPLHARQRVGLWEELVLARSDELDVLVGRDGQLQVLHSRPSVNVAHHQDDLSLRDRLLTV